MMLSPVIQEPDIAELNKLISRAKLQLMMEKNSTFFSALLANMKLIITSEIPTARTNGLWIKFNPHFLMKQTQAKTLGLMLHEIFHVIHDHIEICIAGNLDPVLHNIAGDHYNNLILLALGYELPDNGYHDSKYIGWSTMQIYLDLLQNPPPNINYALMDLEGEHPEGMSPQEHHETIISNIVKAVNQAKIMKDPGSIPAHILLKLEDVLNPKLPWYMILWKYLDVYARNNYSWSRPNRRFSPEFYLPMMRSEELRQVTAGVDVSGSMTTPILSEVMAELNYMWDTMQPLHMHLMTFDTIKHLDKIYNQGDRLDDVQLMGGGGTNIQPLLDSIVLERPELALIFTDGFYGSPSFEGIAASGTDIIWIIKGNPNFSAPVGEIIHMDP